MHPTQRSSFHPIPCEPWTGWRWTGLLALAVSLIACATGVPTAAGPPVVSDATKAEVRPNPAPDGDRVALALELQRQGRLEEAAAQWRSILEEAPDHGPAHARLAAVLDLLDDEEGARAHAAAARRLGHPVPAQILDRPAKAAPAAADVAVTVGPQVRVDQGGDSFTVETAALTREDDPSEVIVLWYDSRQIPGTPPTLTRLAMALSQDGGKTWSETLLDVPAELLSRIAGDPMVAHDPRTGTTWIGGVSLGANASVFVFRRDRGAAAFGPAIKVWKHRAIDKPLMAAGLDPQDPARTRLYVTHNLGLQVSADLGTTWSDPVPLGDYPAFQPRTGPGGELYVVYWDLADAVLIRRSFDGGRTLEPPIRVATRRDFWSLQQIGFRFPGKFRVPPLAYLAVDPRDGALYVVYFDTTSFAGGRWDVDLYLTKSTDRGATWSPPRVINGDGEPPGDQFFPWIEVDRRGRVHVVFYDTRNTVQEDDSAAALVDAYYAVSADGGTTWSEHRLTPAPFSSGAPYPDWLASQFLGDYNGLAVAGDRAYPVYMSTQNGNADVFAHAIDLGGATTCASGGEDLCLNGGRFRVRAAWETTGGESGTGRAVQLTEDAGYFWFFTAENVEVVVKVLDACAEFQRYWVFSTGLTDVGVRLTVEDLRTGATKEYVNPTNTSYAPKLDTDAFRTCGAP